MTDPTDQPDHRLVVSSAAATLIWGGQPEEALKLLTELARIDRAFDARIAAVTFERTTLTICTRLPLTPTCEEEIRAAARAYGRDVRLRSRETSQRVRPAEHRTPARRRAEHAELNERVLKALDPNGRMDPLPAVTIEHARIVVPADTDDAAIVRVREVCEMFELEDFAEVGRKAPLQREHGGDPRQGG
jgi:hypothetical protein